MLVFCLLLSNCDSRFSSVFLGFCHREKPHLTEFYKPRRSTRIYLKLVVFVGVGPYFSVECGVNRSLRRNTVISPPIFFAVYFGLDCRFSFTPRNEPFLRHCPSVRVIHMSGYMYFLDQSDSMTQWHRLRSYISIMR